jgi:ribonuclease-3
VVHVAPVYFTVEESGPDHARQFTVEVSIQGQVRGRGTGRSKQAAEQAAACAALDALSLLKRE